MEPQQEKEKQILQYLTYALFGVMLLAVSIVIYNDSNDPSIKHYAEEVIVPEINLLSREDFQVEKANLIKNQELKERSLIQNNNINDDTKEPQFFSQETVIPDKMIIENTGTSLEQIPKTKKVKTIEPDGTVIYEDVEEVQTIPSDSEIRLLSNSGKKDLIFVQGDIHKVDLQNKYVTLMQDNGQGLATFRYDSETAFLINGKQFNVSNLAVGDNISAEGYGYEGTFHLLNTDVVTLKEAFAGF